MRSRPIISRIMAAWPISALASSPTRRPSRRTTTRSAQRSTSLRRWEIRTTRHARVLEVADHAQEPVGLGEREARGRLVEDQEAGLERQRLGDLDQLHLRQGQEGHRRVGGEVGPEPVQDRAHLGPQRRPVDQPQRPAPARLAAEEHVARDVEIVEQVELLVDDGDAGGDRLAHREPVMLDPVDPDRARGRARDPAQDLHQGRLAGTVLADQAQHLAAVQGEVDPAQRHDAGIGLDDAVELEKRWRHGSAGPRVAGGPAQPQPLMRAISSASNASTLPLSMILVGTMISSSAGMPDLSPSRYLAIRSMPW